MVYTVGEMAKRMGVAASTLRYYDKEGLLPFVERSPGGIRLFRDSDVEWLNVIACLKSAGMSISDIREYIHLAMQGDGTIDQRLELFRHQRETLLRQMAELQNTLNILDYKCWLYEQAQAAGSMEAVKDLGEDDLPERFHGVRRSLRSLPGMEKGK